jgi:hypothetical protein
VGADAVERTVLFVKRQLGEGDPERRPDVTAREAIFGGRAKPVVHGNAPLHPVPLAPEQAGNGGGREVVIADVGTHQARLIQGGERAGGRVGHQQQAFLLDG